MSRGKHFSEKEIEYIKVHILDQSIKEIADALGRNYWAIHRLVKTRFNVDKAHRFTPDEDFKIKKLYPKMSAKYIATIIGVDEISIFNRVKKLGLTKNNI